MSAQGGASGDGAASDTVPIINPTIDYNYQAGIAVFVIRNPDTGKVEMQYPSQKVVDEYIRHGAATTAQDGAVATAQDGAVATTVPAGPEQAAARPADAGSRSAQPPAAAAQPGRPAAAGSGTDQLA